MATVTYSAAGAALPPMLRSSNDDDDGDVRDYDHEDHEDDADERCTIAVAHPLHPLPPHASSPNDEESAGSHVVKQEGVHEAARHSCRPSPATETDHASHVPDQAERDLGVLPPTPPPPSPPPTDTMTAAAGPFSRMVILRLDPRKLSDASSSPNRGRSLAWPFVSGMMPTPPDSQASSGEEAVASLSPSPSPKKRKQTLYGVIAPGMYGRAPNPRRAATKGYRGPSTPTKETPPPLPPPPPPAGRLPIATEIATQASIETRAKMEKRSLTHRTSPESKSPKTSSISTPCSSRKPTPLASKASQASSGPQIPQQSTTSSIAVPLRPVRDVQGDQDFVRHLQTVLEVRCKSKRHDMGWRQAHRISRLLKLAKYPAKEEALFLSAEEAAAHLQPGRFWNNVIVTEGQQSLPLQTVPQFLNEYYEDDAYVWIQDPKVIPSKQAPITKQVRMRLVKDRLLSGKKTDKPWNLLELATHYDDGLRPAFLNTEDARLLTKLKIPDAADHARRRVYEQGYKEVEKWALLAQAGALTEPHQDSHGYSTFITINMGLVGFGWLSFPTPEERAQWRRSPSHFEGGQWRYIILKPGQTIYFPAGTVHFVFRSPHFGNTLAFGGHILRCSNIVHWAKTLIEERDSKDITNEDLTDSATGYLDRVEKFVHHARATESAEKWGGESAIEEFLELKKEFARKKQRKS